MQEKGPTLIPFLWIFVKQNFKKFVSNHKDVVKSASFLTSWFASENTKYLLSMTLKQFYKYQVGAENGRERGGERERERERE